jgi:hypothetical protein
MVKAVRLNADAGEEREESGKTEAERIRDMGRMNEGGEGERKNAATDDDAGRKGRRFEEDMRRLD